MSEILQKLTDVDPNDSEAVKSIIIPYFQKLLKYKDVNCTIWLRVLENVINWFPRYCAQYRTTIENYVAHFLTETNYYDVVGAAKCAHSLQQIRPSQDKTATPKNCWREQMAILCNTANLLMDAIFNKTVTNYKNNNNISKHDGTLLANCPLTMELSRVLNVKKTEGIDKKMALCYKLRNIFIFIQAMLVEVYPVAKPIQPQLILEVIVQALTISSNVEIDVEIAAIIKVEALKTIDALIACLGSNFIPFSGLVFSSVMQTLRWSSENSSNKSSQVRVAAYKTLNKWLSTLHVHRVSSDHRGRTWEDEITKHIVDDITPVKKVVQLTMSTQPTKNLSKKAKRKLNNSMLKQSTISSHMPGEKNKINISEQSSDEIANAALECAETFFTVCGIFLKPTTHKIFHERLVRECFSLDNYKSERALYLLRALDATRKNTPTSVPPPTQYCVALYSKLINSRCDEIRKFCSQAILDIRLHLHCSPPSLSFAMEFQQEEKQANDKEKKISEKNLARLAYLENFRSDGESAANSQEGNDIAEPSIKKPRLDEDKIVICSDSDDDVQEISADESSSHESEQEPATQSNTLEDKEDSQDDSQTEQNQLEKSNSLNGDTNIHEADTQLPVNVSNESVEDDKSIKSMEIAYDIPDANKETKSKVLEKMDDENLPSTNDTDDVQITCGQVVMNSQDVPKDIVDGEGPTTSPPTNGIEEAEKLDEDTCIEIINDSEPSKNIQVTVTSKEVDLNDMLAAFVDEVQDESSLVIAE